MPLLRLDNSVTSRMLKQQESGLGYQIVNFRNSGLVIFNATVGISLDELRSNPLSEEDYGLLSGDPDSDGVFNAERLSADDEFRVVFSQFEGMIGQDDFGLSFSESAIEPPRQVISGKVPRSFYRFSAFHKDKRVSGSGDFLPGTYATTYTDMHFVPSGYAAVGRYALPNPASARFLFSITTFDRPSLMGTATPNFGQAGGGVEVLFAEGAKNHPGASFPVQVG